MNWEMTITAVPFHTTVTTQLTLRRVRNKFILHELHRMNQQTQLTHSVKHVNFWKIKQHPPHTPQPFYGPFSRTTRVSRCQKRTLWCKGRLTEADTPTIWLGATPSGLTSATSTILFFTGRMPFLPPNQQCQSTEGNQRIGIREKTLEFSSTVLPTINMAISYTTTRHGNS